MAAQRSYAAASRNSRTARTTTSHRMSAPPALRPPPARSLTILRPRGNSRASSFAHLAEPKLRPHPIHLRLRPRVHLDHRRPLPAESLLRPLLRRIDAHLRPVRERPARVIQYIHRPHREARVAFRIDVVERHPPRLARIAHVHPLVDDHQ